MELPATSHPQKLYNFYEPEFSNMVSTDPSLVSRSHRPPAQTSRLLLPPLPKTLPGLLNPPPRPPWLHRDSRSSEALLETFRYGLLQCLPWCRVALQDRPRLEQAALARLESHAPGLIQPWPSRLEVEWRGRAFFCRVLACASSPGVSFCAVGRLADWLVVSQVA